MPDLIGLQNKLIALGIVIVLIALCIGVEEWRIHDRDDTITAQKGQITQLTGDLAVANANVTALKGSITRQNSAIAALKDQQAALDASVQASALQAQKNRAASVPIDGAGVDSMNSFFTRLFQ